MSDKYTYKKKEQKKNNYTYEVIVLSDYQKEVQEKVYKKLSKDVKVAGFRPGKAPRDMIEGKIAMDVLNETVNQILPDVSYEILTTEKLNPLSRLNYAFKEFNKDGGLTFEFSFLNSPEIKVSDLKKIKVASKTEPVTDVEVDLVIRNIIQSTLPKEKWGNVKNEEIKELKNEENKSDEKKEKNNEKEPTTATPFEITDELVAELGYEDEKTYAGLKKKVRESLEEVKNNQADEEFTGKVIDEAMKVVDFEVPHDLIHEEIHKREAAFLERLKNINLDLEAYLKTQNKTMDQIHDEWHKDIEKGAFGDILAINLAVQEKLVPTEEDLEAEIEKVEDKVMQVQYRGNPAIRDQLRTFMTRNNGIKKLIEIVKGK
ncbi:MAG: trigger factor [Candidatus Dojkabacteria bacterium]